MLDYRMATEPERKTLSIMMSSVFCEIRLLCRQGNETQAGDLSDVFHNLPLMLYQDGYSIHTFLEELEWYREKYQQADSSGHCGLYRSTLTKIQKEREKADEGWWCDISQGYKSS